MAGKARYIDIPLLDGHPVPGELVIRRETRRVGRLGNLSLLGRFLTR